MTSALARIGLLLAVIATAVIRHQAVVSRDALVESFDIGGAIKTLLRQNGLALLENPAKPSRILSIAVYFQRPQCAQHSVVMPLSLNYEGLPILDRIVKEGYDHRFIYLDGAWQAQSRVPIFVEWLRHAILNVVGASRYLPVKTAVVLADPADCPVDASVDWRLLWDKTWNEQRKVGQGDRREKSGEAAAGARLHS
jgi:hypothetical protein